MEETVYNFIQGLTNTQLVILEDIFALLGLIFILIGIHLLVEDTVEWVELVKNPRVSTFVTVHMYFTFYLPMFIFFLVDGSTVTTFVVSLLLFAVVYTGVVWFRVGRYTENWSVVRPFFTYIRAQDHVCTLVIGSVLLRTVLSFIKIRIG